MLTQKLETASLNALAEVIGLMVVKSSGAKSVSTRSTVCWAKCQQQQIMEYVCLNLRLFLWVASDGLHW